MLRALALVAVVASAAAGDPLPAAPVIPASPVTPAPPLVVEALGGVGASIRGTVAATVGVRFLRHAWSGGGELELVPLDRGGATVFACRHVSLIALCPVAHGGFVHESSTAPLVQLGARVAGELQVSRRLAVRVRFDERVRVTSSAYTDRFESWFGADLVVRIR